MRLRSRFAALLLVVGASRAAWAQRLPVGAVAADLGLYSRLLAMTDTRQLDTALVRRVMKSTWRPLRAAGALAIGQVGLESGLPGAPTLRVLLADQDRTVSANAAYALGLLRDSASIAALSAQLGRDREVAREAAWALGEIGAPARGQITGALQREHPDDVSIQLLLAAAKLRPIPVADLRRYLKTGAPPVVWAASYAIARTRAPGGIRDLLGLLDSPAARTSLSAHRARLAGSGPYDNPAAAAGLIRAEVARALSSTAAGDSLGAQAFTALTRLASDADPHVRINALRSLGTYKDKAAGIIAQGAHDPDPNVRVAAAQSLSTSITLSGGQFAALWAADTSIVYRSSLLASAARAGLRPPPLREWASSPDWHLRAAVASATGDTLDRAFAISRVAPLLRDRDARVREAAYGALTPGASMPLEDSVHAMLVAGLTDADFYVRATVLGALGERPSAGDLGPVLASYQQAAGDSANDARLAAIQYVAALWKHDSASVTPTLRSQLAALSTPADPLERAAGSSLAVWSKWAAVKATPRPSAWYDSLVRTMILPILSGKSVNATINTIRGPIRLELFAADAPTTVWNFLALARSGYYRNTRFHRVVPNFVAQDGDPRDDGNGGPGYAIRDEMNRHRYERGAVGMALSGPDTGGSQYFITHSPQAHLDGHYTVFGRVVRGYDVLDKIVQGDLITSIDPR